MIALALLAALLWGTADFLGGHASRDHPAVVVALVGQVAGLLAIALILLARGADGGAIPAGLVGGGFGVIGVVSFYRALALGTMSVVAPIVACGAILPVLAGVLDGERPAGLQWVGIAAALAGVVLASAEPGGLSVDARRSLALAAVAAVAIGGGVTALARAAEHDALTGVGVARATAVPLLGLLVLRAGARAPWRAVPRLAAIGLCDTAANGTFALATTTGLLSIVAALSGLYPVVTVALAYVLLRERLRGIQRAGVLLALAGVPLISAG